MVDQFFGQPLLKLEDRSSQETAYAFVVGLTAAVVAILGSFAVILTEITLLILLAGMLLIIDPAVTVAAVLYFALVGAGLQRLLGRWSGRLGASMTEATVQGYRHVQEAVMNYREVAVTQRSGLYARELQSELRTTARGNADSMFVGQLPKLAYEVALVVGAVGLAVWQLTVADWQAAVAVLGVFLVAGTRVIPSMLRLSGQLVPSASVRPRLRGPTH